MRRRMKGGDSTDFVETMFASGVGAYAAKNATSMGGLLWTLAEYSLAILLIVFVVWLVIRLLFRDKFVPTGPSQTGDKKETTPAGNVILY